MCQWLLHGCAVALGLKLCRNCVEVFPNLNKDPPNFHFSSTLLKLHIWFWMCLLDASIKGCPQEHAWTSSQTTWLWRRPTHHHLSHQNNDSKQVAPTRLQFHLFQNIPRGSAYKQRKHLPYLPPEANNRQTDLITRVNTPIKSPESCYLGIDLTGVEDTAFSEFQHHYFFNGKLKKTIVLVAIGLPLYSRGVC